MIAAVIKLMLLAFYLQVREKFSEAIKKQRIHNLFIWVYRCLFQQR